MTAFGTPAAAGPPAGPFAPDRRDWLRLLGGVAFAAGAVVLAIRKGGDWSDWVVLLLFLVPCVALYAPAFAARRALPGLQGWQSAFLAFAVLLLPAVLLQFIEAIDGSTGSGWNLTWIFGVCAAVAAATALRARAWWQMFAAGVYAGVAWLAFWGEVLDDPTASTVRALLILFAVLLVAAAVLLARAGRPFVSDLVTVAGIAAVIAGAISLSGLASEAVDPTSVLGSDPPSPSNGWNLFLLAISLALIAYGARSLTRGPAYVGAIGLVIFLGVVGEDIVAQLEGDPAKGVAGWPLVLLLGGAALAAASFLLPADRDGGVTTEPPGRVPDGRAPAAAAPPAPPPPPPGGGWEPPRQ
jgi:hypothetical protein